MTSVDENTTFTGQVEWFDTKKGFGFIRNYNNGVEGKQIFVHYSDILDNKTHDRKFLTIGDQVKYEEEEVADKEPKAINVRPIIGKFIYELVKNKPVKDNYYNYNNYNDTSQQLNIAYEFAKAIDDFSSKIKGKGKGKGKSIKK